MIYGYLRVSTDMQDKNSQKQGVDDFATKKGWKIDEYITDEGVSGGKDPSKRNLGPLLGLVKKGDIIISSEISRLGRDLYMVMDILHFCMEKGCVIYTVKDNFILGDDIQSKVLAFAFGLAAEIERQMIRQRTKEGLKLRMKLGVLVGRPPGTITEPQCSEEIKNQMIEQFTWGVPLRRMEKNFNMDRNTITRYLHKWGVHHSKFIENSMKRRREEAINQYKDGGYKQIIDIDREKLTNLIKLDLTIPQIKEAFPDNTYEEIYDTILCDDEFNALYRQHGQKKVKKPKK